MSVYSCHSDKAGPSPRGRPTEIDVQYGYIYPTRPDTSIRTRVPMIRTVRTEWLPMKCGALKQAGKTDPNCVGCVNRTDQ